MDEIKGFSTKTTAGFTLVETVAAVCIFSLIIAAVISLYVFGKQSLEIGGAYLDLCLKTEIVMENIIRDIRSAREVIGIKDQDGKVVDDAIQLKVFSIDGYKKIIPTKYDYITYRLDGSAIVRDVIVDDASSRESGSWTLTENCSSLVFSSGGLLLSQMKYGEIWTPRAAGEITVNLTTSKRAGLLTARLAITSTAKLRNRM